MPVNTQQLNTWLKPLSVEEEGAHVRVTAIDGMRLIVERA